MPPRENFALSARERAEAREALLILADSGLSLVEAARRAVADGGRSGVASVPVAQAVDRFFLSRVRKTNRRGQPLRQATLSWYEQFLAPLVRDFGAEPLAAIDHARFATWLHALIVGDTTRTSIVRAARALWRWSLQQHPPLALRDPTLGIASSGRIASEDARRVLTVAQAEAMLRGAGNGRSALALALFAGVRPDELASDRPGKPRLCWAHVDAAEKFVRVPAEISKTGKTRLLDHLPDALWAWLQPGDPARPVSPVQGRVLRMRASAAAKLKHWPHDCLRHTAATYLLAWSRDAGRVAEWLGHEGRPSLLHQTYRGMMALDGTRITHEAAEAYFALRPASAPTDGAAG